MSKKYLAVAFMLLICFQLVNAADLQIGEQEITIKDNGSGRELSGFLWYPTKQTDTVVEKHGGIIFQTMPVTPQAQPADGQYPLVVLSHGLFGNIRNQVWLAEVLVKNGYVVAAINHPGTSSKLRDKEQRRELWERPRDISRTIDFILANEETKHFVDADRIYAAGHSLGGFTVMLLAGARYDKAHLDAFCANNAYDIVCGLFNGWGIAQSDEDKNEMQTDLSDSRIKAIAVFDLGGTQSFSNESLATIKIPLLVYGAPNNLEEKGLNIDVESRALVSALPKDKVTYIEPEGLAHFDFLGVCKAGGLETLQKEEPDDAFICMEAGAERQAEHDEIIKTVLSFFDSNK